MTTGWRPPPSGRRRNYRGRGARPPFYVLVLFVGTVVLCSGAPAFLRGLNRERYGSNRDKTKTLDVDEAVLLVERGALAFDAILVLGGGPPVTERRPLPFVEGRCDASARIFQALAVPPKILCLSAGTAHAKQLLREDGLPVWESTAAAAYLIDSGVPKHSVLVETTSYDTIGNAYFARTSHTDVAGWQRLCIITSDFHMPRSKAIFEWVFGGSGEEGDSGKYELTFVETSTGASLTEEALSARREREASSLLKVHQLARAYPTLADLHTFLTTQHDLYTAHKLADHQVGSVDSASLASYGGMSSSSSSSSIATTFRAPIDD